MHIVTASDNNYVCGVLVLLSSASRHNPEANFTVIATNWSSNSIDLLESLTQRLNIRVDLLKISEDRLASFPITRPHLSSSTYARLFIPDILPDQDRVIYMDCDMIVTGSLSEAWDCDLTSKVLAAVRCPTPTSAYADAIKIPIRKYFNAGFLVLNLSLWRSENIAKICLDAISAPECPYLSQDESALNDVARDRVLYLPPGFNCYSNNTLYQPSLKQANLIRVIHFVTSPKPWNGKCTFAELWHAEVARIPELLHFNFKKDSYKSKIGRLNRLRKAWMGQWVGKDKYKKSRQVRSLIEKQLIPYYLKNDVFPEIGL